MNFSFEIFWGRSRNATKLIVIDFHTSILSGNRERGAGDPRRRLRRRADRWVRQHVRLPLRRQGYQVGYKWYLLSSVNGQLVLNTIFDCS